MTDAAGHLDLDRLADVLAGEQDDTHLRSCRSCRDRLAELATGDASVRAALGALPAPGMPEGLAARLASALEQERRQEERRRDDLRTAAPERRAAVRPLRRRTGRRPAAGWLPAVAASAALVMAGAVGWSVLGTSGGSSDATTSAAGGGSGEESSMSTEADTAAPEAAAGLAAPRADTPTDWADEGARPAGLARLLEQADLPGTSAVPPSGDALARLRDPAALQECVSALPGGGGDVLAVDYAQYAGAPAVAVVRPQGPASVTVTVVGPGCSSEDPAVLSTAVLPRP